MVQDRGSERQVITARWQKELQIQRQEQNHIISLLEAASVAGREFVAGVLASALGWTEDETELRCAALARQGTFIRDAGVLEFSRDATGRVTGFVINAGRVRALRFDRVD